jgi:hypothetical protein
MLCGTVMQEEDMIHLPVWSNPLICCFKFFSVTTYHSELIVAPIPKNSTNKIPSLSQKMLAMTLPTEVCTLKLLRGDK